MGFRCLEYVRIRGCWDSERIGKARSFITALKKGPIWDPRTVDILRLQNTIFSNETHLQTSIHISVLNNYIYNFLYACTKKNYKWIQLVCKLLIVQKSFSNSHRREKNNILKTATNVLVSKTILHCNKLEQNELNARYHLSLLYTRSKFYPTLR